MEMKEKVKAEYLRRVWKILETKLNDGSIIKVINMDRISSEVLYSSHRLELCLIDRD